MGDGWHFRISLESLLNCEFLSFWKESPKLSTSQRSLDHPEDQELLAFIYLHIISGFWFNPCVFNTFYSLDIMRGTETKIFYRDKVLHTLCSVQSLSRVPLFATP